MQLTLNELLFLDDSLSLVGKDFTLAGGTVLTSEGSTTLRNIVGDARAEASMEFLLKIGGALLEAQEVGKPVEVTFTEQELWTLREVATLGAVKIGNEFVSVSMKLKVYEALRKLAGIDLGPEREDATYEGKLKEWEEQQNGGTSKNTS